jgi:hypothetical protein
MEGMLGGNLKLIAQVPNNMRFFSSGEFEVLFGNLLYNPTIIPTTAFNINGGVVTIQAQPPSTMTAMDRMVMIKWYWQVQITATAGATGNVVDLGIADAPRDFPAAHVANQVNATINNQAFSLNINQTVDIFKHLNIPEYALKKKLTMAPTAPDMCQNYNDWVGLQGMLGQSLNPLNTYGNSYGQDHPPRGSWPVTITAGVNFVGAGNSGTVTLQFFTMEPLWLSPFGMYAENFSFINVNNLTLSYNFGDMSRVWSHNGGNPNFSTITNMNVLFYSNPELHVTWLTPNPKIGIPGTVLYPYSSVNIYQTDFANAVLPGATATITSNNIQLQNIPTRIIVAVRQRQSDWSVNTADAFAQLLNMNVTFDNRTGILASASTDDLFRMCQENGYEGSYIDWTQGFGSIMLLDVTKNLTLLAPDEAPSMEANKQLQINLTFKNINSTQTMNFTMWIIIISSGLMTISNTAQTVAQNYVLNAADVERAISSGISQVQSRSDTFYGGFIKPLTRSIKQIGNIAKSGLQFAQKHKIASTALNVAQTAGYNPHPLLRTGAKVTGTGGFNSNGVYTGGTLISPQELQEQARKRFKPTEQYEEEQEEEEQQNQVHFMPFDPQDQYDAEIY